MIDRLNELEPIAGDVVQTQSRRLEAERFQITSEQYQLRAEDIYSLALALEAAHQTIYRSQLRYAGKNVAMNLVNDMKNILIKKEIGYLDGYGNGTLIELPDRIAIYKITAQLASL